MTINQRVLLAFIAYVKNNIFGVEIKLRKGAKLSLAPLGGCASLLNKMPVNVCSRNRFDSPRLRNWFHFCMRQQRKFRHTTRNRLQTRYVLVC